MNDIVLFGITGDLARHRLVPTLFTLFINHELKDTVRLFGFGRKPFTDAEFKKFIADTCVGIEGDIESFVKLWVYIESELTDPSGYVKLFETLSDNSFIYLSLPPQYHLDIVKHLVKAKVIKKSGTRKIAFEKPFGSGLESARALDAFLSKHISQNNILRVDHYAGKEVLLDLEKAATLGILDFSLNSKVISKIDIRLHEKKTVGNRGVFYDSVGALFDVGQNHLLYMLSSILALPNIHTSNLPVSTIRSSNLSSVVFSKKALFMQYDSFRKEQGVNPDSQTETFFAIYGKVQNKKSVWNGLPVVLSAGKGLREDDVSIRIYVKGKKEPIKIPVNGYGKEDAYVHIFRAAITGNVSLFSDFKQIEIGWRLVEDFKKGIKDIASYKLGTTPKF